MKDSRKFDVGGMSCAACSARVEKAVSALDTVETCSVNLLTNTMEVSGSATDEDIINAVSASGYSAVRHGNKSAINDNKNLQNTEEKRILYRLVASVLILIPLMYVSMFHVMWGAPLPAFLSENPLAIALFELLLSAIVMVVNSRFFINGTKGLLKLSPNMDTLVSLGSGASFVYSTAVVFSMTEAYIAGDVHAAAHSLHDLYFESAAMILALISIGKFLEARAKGKTTDAIRSLVSLSPKTATVVRDGEERIIPADEVRVGDVFVVRPGESIPVDGVVIDGVSEVFEAALTGESVPKDKHFGDKLLAATINGSGYLRCEATRVGDDTAIAKVIKMVEDASATKAPIAKIADRVSAVFVPLVMIIAAVTFAVWLGVDGRVGYALARGISVLVISCPCALGLATPVAIMVGSGVGAKLGILYKNAEAIELSGKIKTVALDKTGTVTVGTPKVSRVITAHGVSEEELLSVALTLEARSEHPLARAVVEYASGRTEPLNITDFSAIVGAGVRATLDGEELLGAKLSYIEERFSVPEEVREGCRMCAKDGETSLVFSKGTRVLGAIFTADRIRADSVRAVNELHSLGLRVIMLTGDSADAANKVGCEVGVDEVFAELLPDGKESKIRELSQHGGVIMVGDGINDAPALARADVGVAIGGGTDVAIESADVVLMKNDLTDVPRTVRLGRATYGNVCRNLFFAFIYNAIGIPLAAGVMIPAFGIEMSPMLGALAMSLSSFSVVVSALGLNTFYTKEHRAQYKQLTHENNVKAKEIEKMTVTMKIDGMMCPHCEARVKKCLEALTGVESADVSHERGDAIIVCGEGFSLDEAKSAVVAAGYDVL